MIDVLNRVASQVWAVVLIVFGLSGFLIACLTHITVVQSALISSSTGMIGGGIAMLQHETKNDSGTTEKKQ